MGQRWFLFADDTNIQIEATNEDILNKKINRVMQQLIWFHVSGLVINFKKIVAMLFHTWQNEGVLKPQIIFKIWILSVNVKQNCWVFICFENKVRCSYKTSTLYIA
jgi:hypothetical protein